MASPIEDLISLPYLFVNLIVAVMYALDPHPVVLPTISLEPTSYLQTFV